MDNQRVSDGGPAFPVLVGSGGEVNPTFSDGMSLRAWLTGQALGDIPWKQCIEVSEEWNGEDGSMLKHIIEIKAKLAVMQADAAIAELEK